MAGFIEFLSGKRAGKLYFYNNKNIFKPRSKHPYDDPLHLTDFKDVEIISAGPFGVYILIKCELTNAEEYIARIDYSMLEVFKVFILDSKFLPPGQLPIFPISNITRNIAIIVLLIVIVLLLKVIS